MHPAGKVHARALSVFAFVCIRFIENLVRDEEPSSFCCMVLHGSLSTYVTRATCVHELPSSIAGLLCGTKLLGAHSTTGQDAVAKQEGIAKRWTGLVVSLQWLHELKACGRAGTSACNAAARRYSTGDCGVHTDASVFSALALVAGLRRPSGG